MAAIAKSGTPSPATRTPPQNEQISGLRAGEAIAAGDLCTIAADGTVMLASGAEVARGVAAMEAPVGEAVTLYRSIRFGYGAALTPGTTVYLSGTVGGGLDDAATYTVGATTFNAQSVGFAVDATRIQFVGL